MPFKIDVMNIAHIKNMAKNSFDVRKSNIVSGVKGKKENSRHKGIATKLIKRKK